MPVEYPPVSTSPASAMRPSENRMPALLRICVVAVWLLKNTEGGMSCCTAAGGNTPAGGAAGVVCAARGRLKRRDAAARSSFIVQNLREKMQQPFCHFQLRFCRSCQERRRAAFAALLLTCSTTRAGFCFRTLAAEPEMLKLCLCCRHEAIATRDRSDLQ